MGMSVDMIPQTINLRCLKILENLVYHLRPRLRMRHHHRMVLMGVVVCMVSVPVTAMKIDTTLKFFGSILKRRDGIGRKPKINSKIIGGSDRCRCDQKRNG